MGKKKSIVWKVFLGLGIAVVVVGLSFIVVPRLGPLRDKLHAGDQRSPVRLSSRMLVGVNGDRPGRVWNGLHTNYRNQFKAYFDRVRGGSVPVDAWIEAGRKAGGADSAAELSKLDDRRMFGVWWHLKDRSVVGFRLPKFLDMPRSEIKSVVWVKEFIDKAPEEAATEGYVLYKVNDVEDLIHFSRDGGVWRLDVPKEMPEGI